MEEYQAQKVDRQVDWQGHCRSVSTMLMLSEGTHLVTGGLAGTTGVDSVA